MFILRTPYEIDWKIVLWLITEITIDDEMIRRRSGKSTYTRQKVKKSTILLVEKMLGWSNTYVGQKNTLIDSCAYRSNEPNASLNLAGTVTTCHMSFSCDGVRMCLRVSLGSWTFDRVLLSRRVIVSVSNGGECWSDSCFCSCWNAHVGLCLQ